MNVRIAINDDAEAEFEDIPAGLSCSGEVTKQLTPDEWAALTEHVVVSDEPGAL